MLRILSESKKKLGKALPNRKDDLSSMALENDGVTSTKTFGLLLTEIEFDPIFFGYALTLELS